MTSKKIVDRLLLLVAALLAAAVAWAFFHFAGQYAFTIFLVIVLAAILAQPTARRHNDKK